MISRPENDLVARINKARAAFHLTLAQMADELRITPEWLSKLANGHFPPSYNIGLRFDSFLTKRGVDPATFGRESASQADVPAISNQARLIRSTIEGHVGKLLWEAGEDLDRLKWVTDGLSGLVTAQQRSDPRAEQKKERTKEVRPVPVHPRELNRTAILRSRYAAIASARQGSDE